jgi:hypothetical protein
MRAEQLRLGTASLAEDPRSSARVGASLSGSRGHLVYGRVGQIGTLRGNLFHASRVSTMKGLEIRADAAFLPSKKR